MSLRAGLAISVALGTLVLSGCHLTPKADDAAAAPTSATAGSTTIVAIAPPARTPPSIFDFLGVRQAAAVIGGGIRRVQNCLGMRFPGLEATPPVLAITDPANLSADSPPAVKAAAEIKAEEDAAPQKIKALRYLATIGCGGCYPGVEEAFLAALDDCTEEVRYEAVSALRAATGNDCQYCSHTACCSPKVQEKLTKIGYESDLSGCFVEPSARVRRVARLALWQCGSVAPELEVGEVEPEQEIVPEGAEDVAPEGAPTPPPTPTPPQGEPVLPAPNTARLLPAIPEIASAQFIDRRLPKPLPPQRLPAQPISSRRQSTAREGSVNRLPQPILVNPIQPTQWTQPVPPVFEGPR